MAAELALWAMLLVFDAIGTCLLTHDFIRWVREELWPVPKFRDYGTLAPKAFARKCLEYYGKPGIVSGLRRTSDGGDVDEGIAN